MLAGWFLSRDPHVEVILGNHYLVPGETVCLSGSIADAWPSPWYGMFSLGCSASPFFLHFYTERSTPQGLHKPRWSRLILVSLAAFNLGGVENCHCELFVSTKLLFSAGTDHLQGFLFRAVTGTFSHLRLEELQNPLPMQPNQMGDRKLWHLTVQINAASIVWNLGLGWIFSQFFAELH